MIQRHVYIKLDDAHATVESRREINRQARELLSQVPGVLEVICGVPADEFAAAKWDVVLLISLSGIEAYGQYQNHPLHRRFVDEIVEPVAVIRKAWNFEITPG